MSLREHKRKIREMTTYLWNRGQIALALVAHIFEMDNDDLAEAFERATGQPIFSVENSVAEIGDVWACATAFEEVVVPSLIPTVDYLRSQLPK